MHNVNTEFDQPHAVGFVHFCAFLNKYNGLPNKLRGGGEVVIFSESRDSY